MREQNDERRLGHEPLELRERPRPEIAAALPRAWLGIDEDDVARAGLRESRNPDGTCDQRLCENISRRNGIRPAHIIIDDRHAQRLPELRPVTAHEMRRPIGETVGELLMLGERRVVEYGP